MKTIKHSLSEGALYSDFYQLTMAQLYFKLGIHESHGQFDYFFRSYPNYGQHQAGFCIFAGLEWLVNWMQEAIFHNEEVEYLSKLRDSKNNPIFHLDFLNWLHNRCLMDGINLHAIPEGRVVHPQVPIVTVSGPLVHTQILESSLLNHLNYQTLIATKAARIREIGHGRLVLEFGLRRAQDRAASAGTRAALIGGADLSSNTGMSAILGTSPSGTHAHSMVQAIVALGGTELDAFRAFADLYPNNCVLLVDTYDTLESGLPNAIRVFEELRKKGHSPVGIRLDSGDLAYLSIQAAKMLDKAGFEDTLIVLSNQIDELIIWQILTQIQTEAERYGVDPQHLINRLAYGVGTRMITSEGDPALDGVYKLVAVQKQKEWIPAIKISETEEKTLNPGLKSVWRIYDIDQKAIADVIGIQDEIINNTKTIQLHHPTDHTKHRELEQDKVSKIEKLHLPIIENGSLIYQFPSLDEIRQTRSLDLERLYPGVKRLISPHIYHVSLSHSLWKLKNDLIKASLNGDKNNDK